jgi:hypothetical protein
VGQCGIPATAKALSLNVTVVSPAATGDLKLFAAGQTTPVATALSFRGGRTRANNAVLGVSSDGTVSLSALPGSATHLILDVNGYFE